MRKVTIGVLVITALALGCGEEGVTPQTPDRLEPASPVDVLENLELAFDNRDIGLFKAMLSENFVFYFDPREVGQLPRNDKPRGPESGTYSGIVTWVNDLFENAYFLSLSIETGNVGRPDPEENTYRADNLKLTLVVKMDELDGYIYDRYGHVEFEKYAAGNGEDYWRIKAWWDRGRDDAGEHRASTPPR